MYQNTWIRFCKGRRIRKLFKVFKSITIYWALPCKALYWVLWGRAKQHTIKSLLILGLPYKLGQGDDIIWPKSNQNNIGLNVTGKKYKNSLKEANSVDKMVLRWLLIAWIKMVWQAPGCLLRTKGTTLAQSWASLLKWVDRSNTMRVQIPGENAWIWMTRQVIINQLKNFPSCLMLSIGNLSGLGQD